MIDAAAGPIIDDKFVNTWPDIFSGSGNVSGRMFRSSQAQKHVFWTRTDRDTVILMIHYFVNIRLDIFLGSAGPSGRNEAKNMFFG